VCYGEVGSLSWSDSEEEDVGNIRHLSCLCGYEFMVKVP
jgi:hypothetical protein